MLPLPYKTLDIVDADDLDAYILSCTGKEWCTQQNDFYSNDSLISFDVGGNIFDEESKTDVAAWLKKVPEEHHSAGRYEDEQMTTGLILDYLHSLGYLPEGELYVHVWW